MNDQQKPEDTNDTVEQPQVAPAPPALDTAGAEQPAPEAQAEPVSTPRTRRILLTSGAGIALASGVIGFGIGHATADDSGDRLRPTSQYVPGEGQPGPGTGEGQPGLGNGERPDGPPDGMGDREGDHGSGEQRSNGANDPT